MFPADEDRNVGLAPLLADLIQDVLDKSAPYKAPAESHTKVERVGDSRDAGPLRETSPVQPVQLSEGPTEGPASVPLISLFKGKQMKTSETKVDALAKEKLRRKLRLMFAPDVGGPAAKEFKQPKDSKLVSKLTPSTDMARLKTRLDNLAKRLLILESNMDTLSLKMSL